MFHWVNTNQLPLNGMKLQILKLISDVFGGQLITAGQTVWMPSMKEKKLSRVLITGKAVVGADLSSQLTQTDNEFDMDLSGRIAFRNIISVDFSRFYSTDHLGSFHVCIPLIPSNDQRCFAKGRGLRQYSQPIHRTGTSSPGLYGHRRG